jgi:hypothetical protein
MVLAGLTAILMGAILASAVHSNRLLAGVVTAVFVFGCLYGFQVVYGWIFGEEPPDADRSE